MLPYLASFSLEGRIALVTGAGRGLGLEMAQAIAGAGAHVVINGRDQGRLDAAVAAIGEAGGSASAAAFDVADPEALRAALAAIEERCGRLDVVVGNVGQRDRRRLAECGDDDIRALIEVDLVASLILAREAAQRMLPRGDGRLIFVTSIVSERSSGRDAAYASAKAPGWPG
jgi:gluconate 5-dehydrogenase